MEEEISNTPVTGVTERSEVTPVTPSQASASPPAAAAQGDPGSQTGRDDTQTRMSGMSLTNSVAPPSHQNQGSTETPIAVTNEDLGGNTQQTDFREKGFHSFNRVETLPAPEELTADLRENFLKCMRCLRVFDGEAVSPRRLPCSHAVCGSCLERSGPGHSDPCPQCPEQRRREDVGGEQRPAPDLPRIKLLELLRVYQTAGQREDSPGRSSELLASLVEGLLTCAICQTTMEGQGRTPHLLPCMHELCATCSLRLTGQTSGRCHECRQSFTAQESAPNVFLQMLLQWLLPYREHVPTLTQQPDDVTTRMYALQELLERREEQVTEQMRGLEQRRALERFLSLFDARRRVADNNQPLQLAWKALAETCLGALQETVRAGINSSSVVWSTAKVVYDKMLRHLSNKSGFAQALAETDGVKILSNNLRHPPFLSSMDDEHVRFFVKTSMDILHSMAELPKAQKRFLTNNTAEAAAQFLTMDHVESGLAPHAARLLERMCEVMADRRTHLLDDLGERQFAERCYRLLESTHARCLAREETMLETAGAVYKMIKNYAALCKRFATGMAEAGAVALLTTNCKQLGLVAEITNENWSFLVDFSLQILQYIVLVDGTEQYFEECSTLEAMPGLFGCSDATLGVLLNAMSVVGGLIKNDRKGWQWFGDAVAETGFAEKISGCVQISLDVLVDSKRFHNLRFVIAIFGKAAGHSSGARKALAESGFVKVLTDNICTPVLTAVDEETKTQIFLDMVGFLLQLSWDPNARPSFERSHTVQALEPFLRSERDVVLRQAAFMITVNVSDDRIANETDLTVETVSLFRSALVSPKKAFFGRTHYLHLVYFCRILAQLAQRNNARAQILNMKIIPDLDKALGEDDREIHDLAALCKTRLLS